MLDRIEYVVEVLSSSFKKQLHLRPIKKFPVTKADVDDPEGNEEHQKFMKFSEESRRRGWKENIISKDIVLLNHD